MKKVVLLIFIGLILYVFFPIQGIAAEQYLSDNFIFVVVNDRLVSFRDNYPEVHGGITYVPVRLFVESIGANIQWNTHKNSALITMKDKEVILDLSSKALFTNEGHIITDCIYVKNNKIMAPYKFIAKYFGYRVSYIKEGPVARAFNESVCLSDKEWTDKMQDELKKEKERLIQEIKNKIEEENKRKNQEITNRFKIAYITFDDGPTIYTAKILEILEKYDARATFFMLSNNIKQYPDKVRAVANQGNSIGLHGVSHDINVMYQSPETLVSEMHACNSSLQQVAGFQTDLIRVPFGSKPYMTEDFKDMLEKAGFIMWDWNVDSKDSLKGYDISIATITQNVKCQVVKKRIPVILMHEREATVEALPEILEFLKEQNYNLIPIGDNVTPVNFWTN